METTGTKVLSTVDEIFATVGRRSVELPVGEGVVLQLVEVSLLDRSGYTAFVRHNIAQQEVCMAELVRLSCAALRETSAIVIQAKLKPEVLMAAFSAAQELAGLAAPKDKDGKKSVEP